MNKPEHTIDVEFSQVKPGQKFWTSLDGDADSVFIRLQETIDTKIDKYNVQEYNACDVQNGELCFIENEMLVTIKGAERRPFLFLVPHSDESIFASVGGYENFGAENDADKIRLQIAQAVKAWNLIKPVETITLLEVSNCLDTQFGHEKHQHHFDKTKLEYYLQSNGILSLSIDFQHVAKTAWLSDDNFLQMEIKE